MLMSQLSGGGLQQISSQVGADEQSTNQIVGAAIPLLVSTLAKNASQPGGADALSAALQQHDGGVLDNLGGFFGSSAGAADGSAILGHVLGNRQDNIQNALAKQSGLDAGSIGKILVMLAPLVMGALGKAQRQNGFDAGSLSGYLNGEQQRAQMQSPDMMGMLTSMLDANNDGSILDDLGNIAGKLFGKK